MEPDRFGPVVRCNRIRETSRQSSSMRRFVITCYSWIAGREIDDIAIGGGFTGDLSRETFDPNQARTLRAALTLPDKKGARLVRAGSIRHNLRL